MNHLPVQYLIGGTEKLSDAAWTLNAKTDAEVLNLALPDDYIEHGSVDLLRSEVMLNIESCVARIITAYIAEESRRD